MIKALAIFFVAIWVVLIIAVFAVVVYEHPPLIILVLLGIGGGWGLTHLLNDHA